MLIYMYADIVCTFGPLLLPDMTLDLSPDVSSWQRVDDLRRTDDVLLIKTGKALQKTTSCFSFTFNLDAYEKREIRHV